MHNAALHTILEAFTVDAAAQLAAETSGGAEIPFEIVQTEPLPGRRPALYCYQALTGSFIEDRTSSLATLPSYMPAVQALAELEGLGSYLRLRGEPRLPREPQQRAELVLTVFLSRVFAECTEFGFEPLRFEGAYRELELSLYQGRAVNTVIAPLLGIALEHGSDEVALGNGVSLMRGDAFDDAPGEAVWTEGDEPNVLAVLTLPQKRSERPPLSVARSRFRRILTALRLFERGGYALGPIGWTRTDLGPWRLVPLGGSGRPRLVTFISSEQAHDLRAFVDLVARRVASGGEVAWALSRFEMGCERLAPFEAITDYLLALRALLEPEGPASGRLASRLAVICAAPADRPLLAERTAHAISLERAVIAGLAPAEPGVDGLVDQLAEHLRALLRDVLCGHLDPDLPRVADDLIQEAAHAVTG